MSGWKMNESGALSFRKGFQKRKPLTKKKEKQINGPWEVYFPSKKTF